jgi:dihydrofolate synthase / folylpolyglutamate synthase
MHPFENRMVNKMSLIDEQYQAALDYIYSFVDYSLTKNFKFSAEKFDLGRIIKFLEAFDNPQYKYPVIHIAGTKGKGSTGAMITSVLQAAGYRVGFYTSPHLQEFTERIKINEQEISQSRFVELVEYMKPEVEKIKRLTTFELATALGFIYFAQEKVDFAVIEVGLGGRLDATNVVDPLVSVITSLSLDHIQILGDTIEKIAFEKGGIIKSRKPVITAAQKPEAYQVLESIAGELNSPLFKVDDRYKVELVSHSFEGQVFRIKDGEGEAIELKLPLLGAHQLENAVTAYAVLDVIKNQGYQITPQAIGTGFSQVSWPARFEIITNNPTVILDSAHNRDSAKKLRQAIEDYLSGMPVILVFGASDDKDIQGMFAELLPGVERVIVTKSIHPRSMDPSKLVAFARPHHIPCEIVTPIEAAIDSAQKYAKDNAAILVTGSIFVAAGARQYLLNYPNPDFIPDHHGLEISNKKQVSK